MMPLITETNRIQLVLFGTQNRTVGPYSAEMHRIAYSSDA
jgi:aromatic ring-cleaving dioxygenase